MREISIRMYLSALLQFERVFEYSFRPLHAAKFYPGTREGGLCYK